MKTKLEKLIDFADNHLDNAIIYCSLIHGNIDKWTVGEVLDTYEREYYNK
jgi:hypothetical protein